MASYQVFARKYRPRTFDDVLGQDHVVTTLKNAITQKRVAHAYLFVGPRGTGKTSTARILAKALNCPGGPSIEFDPDDPLCVEIAEGRNLDVLEIDGASNNGVEQVRELRETVKFAPSSGQYKIYYIDEVHMLSTPAFNALLKTLEEPPEHVKFFFATTEPNKILPTIISRCQRFDLRRIPDTIIADHLLHIASEEGLTLDPVAAHAIAKGAEGGMRDAQSMLDQLVAFCGNKIGEPDVLNVFGFTSHETISSLAGAILNLDTSAALEIIYQQSESGKDLGKLLSDLIGHLRNLLVFRADPASATKDLPPEAAAALEEQSGIVSTERLLALIDLFADIDGRMKWAPNKKLHFEIGVIKAIQTLQETTLSDVIEVLGKATGGVAAPPHRTVEAKSAAPKTASLAAVPPPPSSPPTLTPAPAPAPAPASAAPTKSAPKKPGLNLRAAVEAADPSPPPPSADPEPEAPAGPTAPGGDDPAPVSEADPDISGAELWQKTVDRIAEKKPLLVEWARHGAFVEKIKHNVVIGFPPDHKMARDHLDRPNTRKAIENFFEAITGSPLFVRFEVRDNITGPLPVRRDPPPEAEPAPTPTPTPEPPAKATAGPDESADTKAKAEEPIDPEIESALKIFGAKLTK